MSDAPEEANDVEAGAGAQTKRSRFSRSIRKVDKRQNRVSNFVYDTGMALNTNDCRLLANDAFCYMINYRSFWAYLACCYQRLGHCCHCDRLV